MINNFTVDQFSPSLHFYHFNSIVILAAFNQALEYHLK